MASETDVGLRPWTQASISGTESWLCRKRCNWLSDRRTTLCRTLGQTQVGQHRASPQAVAFPSPILWRPCGLSEHWRHKGARKASDTNVPVCSQGPSCSAHTPHPPAPPQEASASPPSPLTFRESAADLVVASQWIHLSCQRRLTSQEVQVQACGIT